MKMVKKILLGMAFTAAVLSFVSCGLKEDEQKAIDGENIGYANKDNEDVNPSHLNYRAFNTTETKHYSANAEIVIDNPEEVVSSTRESNAVLGFVFGVKEHENSTQYKVKVGDETKKVVFYDFGIAGVRYNKKSGKTEWYVSWCENVPNTIFGFNDSGAFKDIKFTDADGHEVGPFGTEKQIVPTTGTFSAVDLPLTDGKLALAIRTVAKDTGSYVVELCKNVSDDVPVATATIPAATTGLSAKEERFIGRYVNVYYGETISGTIKYSDVSGNVIPADYRED